MIKLLIGGDIAPTSSNFELFSKSTLATLVGEELEKLLNEADYSIFNLEVPITDTITPILKSGPNLIAPSSTLEGIKKINPYFYCLANNHIMDQGVQGLTSTMELLRSVGISFAGAGKDLYEASSSHIFEKNGIKVGVYCCAEVEFSIATEKKPGANPFDPLESFEHIAELRDVCDFVIVLYHGGKEHYRYPSPYLRKVCRKMVDRGADLVVCQHSHCIGCEENWGSGKIVYGQGNFLFDHSDSEYWKTSLLIKLIIDEKEKRLDYIPICKNDNKVQLADQFNASKILDSFLNRSIEIQKPGLVEEKYSVFAAEMLKEYLTAFSGKIVRNPIYRIINKLSGYKWSKWYSSKKFSKLDRVIMQNYIECEAHRELLIEGLKTSIRNSESMYQDGGK